MPPFLGKHAFTAFTVLHLALPLNVPVQVPTVLLSLYFVQPPLIFSKSGPTVVPPGAPISIISFSRCFPKYPGDVGNTFLETSATFYPTTISVFRDVSPYNLVKYMTSIRNLKLSQRCC